MLPAPFTQYEFENPLLQQKNVRIMHKVWYLKQEPDIEHVLQMYF